MENKNETPDSKPKKFTIFTTNEAINLDDELYCIFISFSKSSARKLCKELRKKHNFITEEPYRDEGLDEIWLSVAIKKIHYSKLPDNVEVAKIVSNHHDSELTYWNLDTDFATRTPSKEYFEARDKATLEMLATKTFDSLTPHEMNCLFISKDKCSAIELCNYLREKQGYETQNLFNGKGISYSIASKKILYSDLEDTIRIAREAANPDESELAAWQYLTDK